MSSWEEPCPTGQVGVLIVCLRTEVLTVAQDFPLSAGPSSEWPRALVALPVLSSAAARPIARGGDAVTVIGHKTPRGAKLCGPGKHSWTSAACWKPSGAFSSGRG